MTRPIDTLRRPRITGCVALFVLLAAAPAWAQEGVTGEIRWEPYDASIGGAKVAGAQLGRLRVPESRARATGRTIDLAFVRLPGRAAGGTPLVYLDGGPGGSGVGVLGIPQWSRLLDGLRDVGDVILLSQRGTGLSQPRLVCGPAGALPGDVLASRDALMRALMPTLDACLERWRDAVDLSSYNSRESAHDVDDVRRALGVARVNLLGFSYGTHLGLAVMREHGASLGRVVLAGTEGPDDTYKLPTVLDTQLRMVSAQVARDASTAAELPDLFATLEQALAALERQPKQLDLGEGRRMTLGAEGLLYLLRADIGDSNDLPLFPALIQDALEPESPGLAMVARRRVDGLGRGISLMTIAMDCASGASPLRMQRIRAEWDASLFGRMSDWDQPDVCERAGITVLDDAFRAPLHSDVPTLFVSGTLDANTPPFQAERVRWGLSNSAHIIVENAGHESTLTQPPVQDAIVAFLRTGELRSAFIAVPVLDYLTRTEALRR